jgi:lipid II:glycine glycyltransferase (peptidoglycan interpeptide bridge formation enzyme)
MQKRGIKKAQKGNLSAEILNNKQGIDSYYQLHLLTRKKQGVPIQPKSFFNRLLKEIIERNYGTIIIVKYGNIAIAGGVFLWYGNTFTYKYGASDPKYLYLRPNNLLFWEAIQLASRMSFCYFDFGKTEIQNEGLRSFKSGWGSKETPLYYSYFPVMLKSGIFSFLKDKVVGPIIRHSPTFVCKWSGELLYKYFP